MTKIVALLWQLGIGKSGGGGGGGGVAPSISPPLVLVTFCCQTFSAGHCKANIQAGKMQQYLQSFEPCTVKKYIKINLQCIQ